MKKLITLLAMLLIFPLLNGCDDSYIQGKDKEITKIILSSFLDKTEEFIITEKDELYKLEEEIINKKKYDGIVNMTDPDYVLTIVFTDSIEVKYNLWVGNEEKTSAISEIDDTDSLYILSSKATQKIQEIIN